jgi:hypothetical protein
MSKSEVNPKLIFQKPELFSLVSIICILNPAMAGLVSNLASCFRGRDETPSDENLP